MRPEMGCMSLKWLDNGSNLWILSLVKNSTVFSCVQFWASTLVFKAGVSGTFHFLRCFSNPRQGVHSLEYTSPCWAVNSHHTEWSRGSVSKKRTPSIFLLWKHWNSFFQELTAGGLHCSLTVSSKICCFWEMWAQSVNAITWIMLLFFYHREVFWVGCWCRD